MWHRLILFRTHRISQSKIAFAITFPIRKSLKSALICMEFDFEQFHRFFFPLLSFFSFYFDSLVGRKCESESVICQWASERKMDWRIKRRWFFIPFGIACVRACAYVSVLGECVCACAWIDKLENGIDFKMIFRTHFKPNMKRCDEHRIDSIEYCRVFVYTCRSLSVNVCVCVCMSKFVMSTVRHVPYYLHTPFPSLFKKHTRSFESICKAEINFLKDNLNGCCVMVLHFFDFNRNGMRLYFLFRFACTFEKWLHLNRLNESG